MSVYDDSGYDLDDPKHPTFMDRMWEHADLMRKREREDAAFACAPDDVDESGGVKDAAA